VKKIFIAGLIITSLSACKKGKLPAPDNNGSISGSWKINTYKVDYYDYSDNYLTSGNVVITGLTFNNDGTITVYAEDNPPYSNYTYTLSNTGGKKQVTFGLTNDPFTHFNILSMDTFNIETLNSSHMVLKTDPIKDPVEENYNNIIVKDFIVTIDATRQ